MHLKMSSVKWRLFCLGVNVLNDSKDLFSILVLDFFTGTDMNKIRKYQFKQITPNADSVHAYLDVLQLICFWTNCVNMLISL